MPGGRQTRFLLAGDKDVQPGQALGSAEGVLARAVPGLGTPCPRVQPGQEVPGSLSVPCSELSCAPHPGPLQRPG